MGAGGPANPTTFNAVAYTPLVEHHRVAVGRHPYGYFPASCSCGAMLAFASEDEAAAWAGRHEQGGH